MAEWTSTISRACAGGGVAAMLAGQTFGGKPMDRRAFLAAGSTAALLPALAAGATRITTAGFALDYFEARHAETLQPIESLKDGPVRLLVAAKIGTTRLIDNIGV